MNAEQKNKVWGQIVAKAWSDAAFKRRLLAEPAAVLKEHGIDVPPGVQFRVVEDNATVRHLTLPARELSEQDLHCVTAGLKEGTPDIASSTQLGLREGI